MKKIVTITRHNLYNLLGKVTIEHQLVSYSAKLIDKGIHDINVVMKELETADLIICCISSTSDCWEQIEKRLETVKGAIVYLGNECRAKTQHDIEISAVCNSYMSFSGNANISNMILYALNKTGVADVAYEEPMEIPWEGIFCPDTNDFFESTEAYFNSVKKSEKGVIGILTSRNHWINGNIEPERKLIQAIEKLGYSALPVFSYSVKDEGLGAKGCGYAIEHFMMDDNQQSLVDGLIRMTAFLLNDKNGDLQDEKKGDADILAKLNCPVIKPVVSRTMSIEDWEESEDGACSDVAWSVSLPELEGAIEPVFIGGIEKNIGNERRVAVDNRIEKLAQRMAKWVNLKRKKNHEKKVVIILNNSPCVGGETGVGNSANLDALESTARLLNRLKQEGYDIENPPANGKELIDLIMSRKAISEFRWTTVDEIVSKGGALDFVSKEEYGKWFAKIPQDAQEKVIEAWGRTIGEEKDGVPPSMIYKNQLVISGISFKNAIVCVQPKRGCAGSKCDGKVCKILRDPDCPPTHQYIATYKYFEHKFMADAMIHMGTHGSLEFLPGKSVGLSESCFPDICVGSLPNIYIYNSGNSQQGTLAKRRGMATIIDHMQTVMTEAGLYDELEEMDMLLEKYEQVKMTNETQSVLLEKQVIDGIRKSGLDKQLELDKYEGAFNKLAEKARVLLTQIKDERVQKGQHILGEIPQGEDFVDFIYSIIRYEGVDTHSVRSIFCKMIGLDLQELLSSKEIFNTFYSKNNGVILSDAEEICKQFIRIVLSGKEIEAALREKMKGKGYSIINETFLQEMLEQNKRILDIAERINQSKELDAVIHCLNGGYIKPGPSGVVTRGRDDVLPTGRNFYTLDASTIPTKMAYAVGKKLADGVINKFIDETGKYPESFAMYWMCNDIMWAYGEGMAQVLYFIGVKPKWMPNGKVCGFDIIPLEELGRPRIDVTIKLSGILRDSFYQCVEIVDEAITAVAELDEPIEMNFIKKHTMENAEEGMSFETASARIFGDKPGTYSTGVSLAVYASAWNEQKDFVDLFTFYNGYVYGKNRYGKEAFAGLKNGLKNVDITFNKVVSDEHDLLSCCCHFGNHGGMTAVAKELSAKEVKTYYGDTREAKGVEVRTLSDEVSRVARGKLLNPKWIENQKKHGYKGALDISQKVGRIYGWEATTSEVKDWIFDDITKTYVVDNDNREFFMEHNPWALEEIERRLIEAYQRKMWEPEDGLIEQIMDSYLELEGFMEEDMGDISSNYQGGSIDIVDLKDVESYKEKMKEMNAKITY